MMFHTMRSRASEHVNVCAYRHPMNAACNKSVLAKVESSPCAWNGDALSRARVRMIFFCDNAIISQIRKKIVGQDNVCVDTLWLQIGVYWLICFDSFSHCSYCRCTLSVTTRQLCACLHVYSMCAYTIAGLHVCMYYGP